MRLLSCISIALASWCSFAALHAADAAPLSPEAQIQAPLQALRDNDVAALFRLAPAEKQTEAVANWKLAAGKVNEDQRAQMNMVLGMLLAPNAVDNLFALAEPQLKTMPPPQELVGYVQMFGGMAAMQMAQDPKTADLGKVFQQLVADVAAWIPASGIEDPKKLREAITKLVEGAQSLGVTKAEEFFALDFDEMLVRCGIALKTTKAAFKVYDLDADTFLGSIQIVDVVGTGDTRTATAKMTAFGHPYSIPVTLVLKDGKWELKNETLEKSLEGLAPGLGGGPGM